MIRPDVEATVVAHLKAADVCQRRVSASVPSDPTWPLVTVQRVGGIVAVRRYLDRAAIQVDAWGDSKTEAYAAATAAYAALLDMEGQSFPATQVFVSSVDDELGFTWSPDPETSRARYLFRVAVHARSLV